MDTGTNLFSASLETIDSSKRTDKFQRFFSEFQRECDVILSNAQEWIKAELPIVESYIELAPLKEELKSNKISTRRKHLLSALIFEQVARDAVRKHQAATAGLMSIHMLNHIWQARLEMNQVQVSSAQANITKQDLPRVKTKEEQEHDLKREQILSSLIKKGEKLLSESQIQKQQQNNTSIKPIPKKQAKPKQQATSKKKNVFTKSQKDLWAEAAEKEKLSRLKSQNDKNGTNKKRKQKTGGVLSKVRTKFPLKRKSKNNDDPSQTGIQANTNISPKKPEDSLLDDPNASAIMVSSGIYKDIDDSLIQARPRFSDNVDESGITVRKVLKKREHETHEPGSNTIIMKLASSAGRGDTAKMSVPEQCQQAVNDISAQFPGYDLVAIRNMAAEKVGVSPQYIENLNILPEKT